MEKKGPPIYPLAVDALNKIVFRRQVARLDPSREALLCGLLSQPSQRKVLNIFYDSMNPDRYVCLGTSESVGRITSAFRLKRAEGNLLYIKD